MSSDLPIRNSQDGTDDHEPLLGRRGDVSQSDGQHIAWNLVQGTAPIAQAGIWILTASVWAGTFEIEPSVFSAHPTLNSAGLLLITQAILILQPTHLPEQKRLGTNLHFALNLVGVLALLAGLIVIEYFKVANNGGHFKSIHADLGIAMYVLVVLQALVGFVQYYAPSLLGGEGNAKAVYKYHRMSGYVVLTFGLVVVCAATQTPFNKQALGIRLWVVLVASVLVLAGVLPRVKLHKLGIKKEN